MVSPKPSWEKLFESPEDTFPVVVKIKGDEFTFTMRNVSWLKRSRIASEALRFVKGEPQFRLDLYQRAMLLEMIVEAPWGKGGDDVINIQRLTGAVGDQLEQHIPIPASMFSKQEGEELKKE